MCKKLPRIGASTLGVGLFLLLMAAATARADWGDDYQAKYLKEHPGFHGLLTPHPPYPMEARIDRDQGLVKVQVTFAAEGRVEDVLILKSSDSRTLDRTTVHCIKQYWRNLTGKPVSRTFELDYHFTKEVGNSLLYHH